MVEYSSLSSQKTAPMSSGRTSNKSGVSVASIRLDLWLFLVGTSSYICSELQQGSNSERSIFAGMQVNNC